MLKFLHNSSPDEVWCLPPRDWNRICRAMRGNTTEGNTAGDSGRNRPAQPTPPPKPPSRQCSGCVGGLLLTGQFKRIFSKEEPRTLLGEVCQHCRNGLRNDPDDSKLDLLRLKISSRVTSHTNRGNQSASNEQAQPPTPPPKPPSRQCSVDVRGAFF